jgi:hypothetical protein
MSLPIILVVASPSPFPQPSQHPAPAPVSSSSLTNVNTEGTAICDIIAILHTPFLPKTELAKAKLKSIATILPTGQSDENQETGAGAG